MRSSDDPVALLPFAVAGILVGIGLVVGCGYGLYGQWTQKGAEQHDRLEGRIEWAGWRRSAAAGGPRWYLQVRIEGDDRGFLAAASEVAKTRRERIGIPEPPGSGARRSIPSLEGRSAVLVVDSALNPENPTPYLSALRVDGEPVVPLDGRAGKASPLWQQMVVWVLLGLGALTGAGLIGVSGQHVLVSIRHRRG